MASSRMCWSRVIDFPIGKVGNVPKTKKDGMHPSGHMVSFSTFSAYRIAI